MCPDASSRQGDVPLDAGGGGAVRRSTHKIADFEHRGISEPLRNKGWPAQASDGWLKIGNLYASVPEIKDDAKALAAYRQALATESPTGMPSLRSQIPAVYRSKLPQN
jgi:hypothetical protein